MRLRLEFKAQDLWVGAYWLSRTDSFFRYFDLWICLLPMLPLHFTWKRERPRWN